MAFEMSSPTSKPNQSAKTSMVLKLTNAGNIIITHALEIIVLNRTIN